MVFRIHSYSRKHFLPIQNRECFYRFRQWLLPLVIVLAATMFVSCGANHDGVAMKNDTTISVGNEAAVTSDATIDNGDNSFKIGNNNPFYLLHQAFIKTKSQLWNVLELLIIILFALSVILYLAEHIAQPNVYRHFMSSILWTFVKSIQDPGEMAPPKPISVIGRTVANIVGIVGVAIFALPAGIISSGFISAMDEEKQKVELVENAKHINELMLIKSNKREGIYWPAKNLSFGDIKLGLGLSEEEILKAVNTARYLRVKNLSSAVNEGPKNDMLVVNQYYTNTPYGSHVERGSSVTIVNPVGESDNGLSFFDWHIAQLGGFNYVANEFFSRQKINEKERCNFYTIDEESEANPYFRQFVDDITRGRDENDWIIVVAGEQTVKNITDFHFEFGGEKGETGFDFPECITRDRFMLKQLYDDFSKAMEEKAGLETDAHQVQPKLNEKNVTRYIQARTKANVLLITVSYNLMVFEKTVHSAIYNFADVLNRNLEIRNMKGLHTEEYQWRSIDSDYWRTMYGLPKMNP